MQLTGTYAFNAPIARVWTLLNDPNVIASCLPGCEKLEPLGDDRYRANLSMAVAAISGQYSGTVALLDKQPPRSYRLVVDGSGKAGFVKGEATVTLAESTTATDATDVRVQGEGQVGGLMARVGQRLLGSVSQMMLDRFFAALREKAEARST
jgi:carbon monoxide dehydrogenase subunit G